MLCPSGVAPVPDGQTTEQARFSLDLFSRARVVKTPMQTKRARSRGDGVWSGGTRKRGWVAWQPKKVCCVRRLRHMRQLCRRGSPSDSSQEALHLSGVCVVHAGHTRTSRPGGHPTKWCALPVGGLGPGLLHALVNLFTFWIHESAQQARRGGLSSQQAICRSVKLTDGVSSSLLMGLVIESQVESTGRKSVVTNLGHRYSARYDTPTNSPTAYLEVRVGGETADTMRTRPAGRGAELASPTSRGTDPDDGGSKDAVPRSRPTPRQICIWLVVIAITYNVGFFSGSMHHQAHGLAKAIPTPVLHEIPAGVEAAGLRAAGRPDVPLEGSFSLAPAAPLPPIANELLEEIPASPYDANQDCLSFNRDMCPPLNLSIQTPEEQQRTHARCTPYVAKERNFQANKAARFCGRRLKRLNPCWSERGVTSCLPHFFILGEMKCGTTTIYNFLRRHPRVVVPRVKEPRFLQPGRFGQTTVSRYKVRASDGAPSSAFARPLLHHPSSSAAPPTR